MKKRHVKHAVVALISTTGLVAASIAAGTGAAASSPSSSAQYSRSCSVAAPGYAACDALRSLRASAQPSSTAALPNGYGPTDLQSAYNLTTASSTKGVGQTVAIVDAFDDPNAEADLAVYRSTYGLPPCTSASGCFKKVAGNGSSTLPAADGGWAQEESLDIDMVSAICPNCKIRLVEATNNSLLNLAKAVKYAAKLGVAPTAISNSYGGGESASDPSTVASYYTWPGVVVTASAGDGGYGVEFPAAAPSVISVGGTALNRDASPRGWSETVWGHGALSSQLGGTGSGCSKYEAKPTWQHDAGCAKRMVSDISAVADPNTGVAVYDSFAYQGNSGWLVFGGTSVSSPIIASIAALSAQSKSHPTVKPGSYLYGAGSSHLYDVTSGSNGSCPTQPSYFCNGAVGYDGPTGLGTPNGNGAVL